MFNPGPNLVAYAVLLSWPVVMLLLLRALGPARGLVVGLLGGYLLLPPAPAGVNLPILPLLDRDTVPGLVALLACVMLYRPAGGWLPQSRIARVLLAALVAVPVFTVLTNGDPISQGRVSLPGLRIVEIPAVVIGQLLVVGPYLLGRALLADEDNQRFLLWSILVGGLAYSLPMLLEVRLSPQINTWIYGYFQHSFEQMMRDGGFRPLVFLPHGLWAALFTVTTVLAACGLLRAGIDRQKVPLAAAGAWMMGVLVLCKSLASLLYGLFAAPLILFFSTRMQMRVAAVLAALTLAYPLARGAQLVPVDAMVSLAASIDADRAQSLEFRFGNEEILLDRAQERQPFGWGIWGRNLVYDPESGRALSISDGRWIIVLGIFGWIGFVGEFGLLALAVLLAWWRSGPVPSPVLSALSLILALNLVDMIPNATLTPLTWLCAGAILGRAELGRVAANGLAPGLAQPGVRQPAFRTIL